MKKKFTNSYIFTYILLLTSLFLGEMIFKVINSSNIWSFSTLRILIGLNIISVICTYLINFLKPKFRKIITSIIALIGGIYGCAQAGFYNFLGVYISLQTSSQLGAVVDYIKDFILSFKWFYFLILIPSILLIIFYIFFDKETHEEMSLKKRSIISLIILVISSGLYYGTIKLDFFQNKFQTVSNEELFLAASNPSLTIEQFGTTGFFFLDIKAMLFPIVIEDNYEIKQEHKQSLNENSRVIDDTAWKQLIETETNKEKNFLNNYFINREIAEKNEYTGLFENKNLIVIMMESTNDIILDSEYYPNFSKIMNEGWYWENNYSPRNSCATMNNEFSGMTSIYSIYNTCTASKYKKNEYFQSIFNLFNRSEYVTFSAHNYTEAYYPRKKIHTSLGSGEYYGVQKLGIPYSNEYINWSNDDDFMEKVLEIIDSKTANNKNFMTWLTTVSSHQPYSTSSIQGNKYYDMTKSTNYPTDVRRYMSKLKILDDALGVLLSGLESRGILDDTVIVLYGDHYPYGISTKNLNKVLEYDTSEYLNAERVPFVIYNSAQESKVFSEYTSYINILPTLANLFNFEYDPRLFLGSDLLSKDYKSLIVFADGSWKNETAFYDASKNKIKYFTSNELSPEEIKQINDDVNMKINVSNKAIKSNYFKYLDEELTKYKSMIEEQKNTMCLNEDKDKYIENHQS